MQILKRPFIFPLNNTINYKGRLIFITPEILQSFGDFNVLRGEVCERLQYSLATL